MKPARSGLGRFVGELKRRRVFQVAAAYAVVGWILVEVADTVFPHLEFPEWTVTFVVWLVLLGFPLALLLAWAYDLTPQGVQPTPPRNESDDQSRPDPVEEPAAPRPAAGPGEAPPERSDSGEPDEAVPAPSGATIGSRPAGWIGVGILLGLVLVGAYVGLTGPEPERADADPEAAGLDSDRVLVMTFENRTGDENLDPVGLMASDGITRSLEATGVLRGVPADQIFAGLGAEAIGEAHDAADVEALARSARARTVVTGRFYARGDSLQFEARARDLVTDQITHTFDPTTAPRSDPAPGLQALQEQIAVALAMRLDPTFADHTLTGIAARQPANLEAYRAYTRAWRQVLRLNFEDAIPYLEDAMEADPDFVEAHLHLGGAYANLGHRETADSIFAVLEERRELLTHEQLLFAGHMRAHVQGDRARAYRVWREYAELVPGNHTNYILGLTAIELNRPAEAVEALRQVDPDLHLLRDWTPYWWHFGRALHMLGGYEEELEVGRQAVERFPGDLFVMRGKLRALAALGQVGEVARWLDAVMREPWSDRVSPGDVARYTGRELRAHGHEEAANEAFTRALEWYRGRARQEDWRPEIASTLYETRRWESARLLAEELSEEAPDDVELRSPLEVDFGFLAAGFHGTVAARMGDRAEAEGIVNELTDAEDVPLEHLFWAARIASVLGEHDEAIALLERAFAPGSRYWLALHRTIDFEPLHGHPGFQELLEPDG